MQARPTARHLETCVLAPLLALALAATPQPPIDNGPVLQQLDREANRSDSDGLCVYIDGQVALDRTYVQGVTNVESVTKLFTGIAIGMLIADGKIPSYDAPLSTWFPEWKKAPLGAATLRQVMQHRSGLGDARHYDDLMSQKDTVAWVVKNVKAGAPPGKQRFYSNAAVALLARVIQKAAGKPEDELLDERLFKPLGIADWKWTRDGAGLPHAWEGLSLTAADLAKVGQVLLQNGAWQGKQLVPAAHLQAMTAETDGMFVEPMFSSAEVLQTADTRQNLKKLGVAHADALAPLDGHPFDTPAQYAAAASRLLPPEDAARLHGIREEHLVGLQVRGVDLFGYAARGARGNTLLVFPKLGVTVARVRSDRSPDPFTVLTPLAGRLNVRD